MTQWIQYTQVAGQASAIGTQGLATILILALAAYFLVLIYTICRAGGDADRRMEAWARAGKLSVADVPAPPAVAPNPHIELAITYAVQARDDETAPEVREALDAAVEALEYAAGARLEPARLSSVPRGAA